MLNIKILRHQEHCIIISFSQIARYVNLEIGNSKDFFNIIVERQYFLNTPELSNNKHTRVYDSFSSLNYPLDVKSSETHA